MLNQGTASSADEGSEETRVNGIDVKPGFPISTVWQQLPVRVIDSFGEDRSLARPRATISPQAFAIPPLTSFVASIQCLLVCRDVQRFWKSPRSSCNIGRDRSLHAVA